MSKSRIKVVLVAFTCIVSILVGGCAYFIFSTREAVAEDKYPIMGPSNVSIGQLINYYNSNASYPVEYTWSDAPTVDAFCQIYLEECAAEGVRVEVAFCQAMKETGYLRFGGAVDIGAYNFAGIGAVDSNPGAYNRFSSVREGVRAQVQHLKAYASTDNLNNVCVDPRFHLVSRGCAPYVEDLGGKWASGWAYGYSIRNEYMAKLGAFNGFCTYFNGVEYGLVYDPVYYLWNNVDLQPAYSGDGYGLIAHFVYFGMNEGRQAKDSFNVKSYKNANPLLRQAYGRYLPSYYYHFINNGFWEGWSGATGYENELVGSISSLNGIDYSSVYDFNYYKNNHQYLLGAYDSNDDIGFLEHFIYFGQNEGLQAKDSFNVYSYKNANPPLRNAFGKNLSMYYWHYMNYGIKDGWPGATGFENTLLGYVTSLNGVDYSQVYDFNYYKNTHQYLLGAYDYNDDIGFLEHFVYFGRNEGQQAKESFNVHSYKNANPPLRRAYGNDLAMYFWHYMNCGIKEGWPGATGFENALVGDTVWNGIDYSDVYDFDYYKNTHQYLSGAYSADNDIGFLTHFVYYGQNEGLQAKSTFNVHSYKNANPPLRNAFGENLMMYYWHYMNYGIKDGWPGATGYENIIIQ